MSKVMKSSEFVKKAKDIAKNYKTLYVMGCFGSPLNEANKKRYTNNNAYNKQPSRTKMINNASSDTFGFDCVCLLKGILWGWSGNQNKTYGGAEYKSNGVPDVGANTMFSKYCTNKSSDFSKIEVGEFVWLDGHIGVYIGDGLAVECTPAWKNKVQITAVRNIGKKDGYPTRKWTKHGKSAFLDYTKEPTPKPSGEFKIGDKVTISGFLYKTANSIIPSGRVPKGKEKTVITRYAKGTRHPYNTTGDLGWISESNIKHR